MDVTCVIPARLGSKRFPQKILAPLGDKPLIQWVYEAAKTVSLFDEIIIAVDAEETKAIVESFGGRAIMTSTHCQSGTDRIIELVKQEKIQGDILVNWQGDEPFISSSMIHTLLQTAREDDCSIWTLCKQIKGESSPHVVKVVVNHEGQALYFSRSSIPYFREPLEKIYLKHIGLYAYTPNALKQIAALPPSPLEEAEQLEQIRFLQGGLKIKVHRTDQEVFGIDTPEDLEKAKLLLGV